jgi:hypothetical protein
MSRKLVLLITSVLAVMCMLLFFVPASVFGAYDDPGSTPTNAPADETIVPYVTPTKYATPVSTSTQDVYPYPEPDATQDAYPYPIENNDPYPYQGGHHDYVDETMLQYEIERDSSASSEEEPLTLWDWFVKNFLSNPTSHIKGKGQ